MKHQRLIFVGTLFWTQWTLDLVVAFVACAKEMWLYNDSNTLHHDSVWFVPGDGQEAIPRDFGTSV